MNYAEKVLERGPDGQPILTELVPLDKAGPECRNPCGHIGVKFEDCWPYTYVLCLVCGRGLGLS